MRYTLLTKHDGSYAVYDSYIHHKSWFHTSLSISINHFLFFGSYDTEIYHTLDALLRDETYIGIQVLHEFDDISTLRDLYPEEFI